MSKIKEFLVVLIILFIIDLPFLNYFMSKKWSIMVQNIQHQSMKINFKSAFVTYLLMAFAIVFYVLPYISEENLFKESILIGGFLGLIIYGIFDLTNLSIIQNYDINIAILDILWGALLFAITTYISKKILISIK